jgi:hypothetical protein
LWTGIIKGKEEQQCFGCIRRRKQLWPDRQALERTRAKQKEKKVGGKTKGHHYLNGIQQQQVCGTHLGASLYQVIYK